MLYRELPIVRVDDETFVPPATHPPVVEEMPLSVTVNGRHALTAMTSPAMIREFVVGFLYTERIVRDLAEIESIRIEGNTASVLTKNPFAILTSHKTVLSGCGGSTSFLDAGHLPLYAPTSPSRPRRSGRRQKRRLTRTFTGSPAAFTSSDSSTPKAERSGSPRISAGTTRSTGSSATACLSRSISPGRLRSAPAGYPPRWSGSAWSRTSR